MATLWHGRFEGGPAEALQALNDSLPFDRRMYREDIAGSRAHVRMLAEVGLLSTGERDDVLEALDTVEGELAEGRFGFVASDEDIHTAVERRVTELAGPAGAKLHTGRSRNDQVATDLRLWVKRELADLAQLIVGFQHTLLGRAEEVGDAYLPGYTHFQQAQPVLLAHHLLAHGWALSRDVDRLLDCRRRADVSPLGAGALAGSSLPLDPGCTAQLLGFGRAFDNSLDAVADRDFVAEALFALALTGVHLSRIGEELIAWATEEFGFVGLDDAFSTGSSMLPQKKNPDIAELARGKAGRLIGHLAGLLATLKGLPLAYNKDLQEDKEPLFDACDTVRLTLLALDGMVSTLMFRTERMAEAADSPYAAAIDLAEYLVAGGMPFREAHAVVGSLVRRALAGEASLGALVSDHEALGPDAAALLAPGVAVRRRTTRGAAGPVAVAAQIERFRNDLSRVVAELAALGVAPTPNIGGVFHHPVRVRYGEVDQQGVVFNAHYLAYCDDAVDTWLRRLSPDFERLGWDVMVKACAIEWHSAAGVGDVLDLVLRVERWGRTSFDVAFEGAVADRTVVSVRTTYVVVERRAGDADDRPTPLPIPAELRSHLGG